MQQVYRATDLSFNRPVALKVPKNESAEKRFARSARMSARVNHPNVAKTLDYFEEAHRSYLIEEFIQGSDLGASFKKRFRYLDPHLSAHLIHHLSKGVAASHRAGVCHRDLKPNNIVVSDDFNLREVKITDFGIAKLAEAEIAENIQNETSITASKTLVGALPYMAPEVIEDHTLASMPADVWALGAMLHFFITGEPPYGVGLPAVPKILSAQLIEPPKFFVDAKQFRPLTNELWDIIQRCLQKDPEQRPTAEALVQECSALCYSSSERRQGTIWDFGNTSGSWGTIRGDDGRPAFFHTESGYSTSGLKKGQRVHYACFPGAPRPRAFPVLPVESQS